MKRVHSCIYDNPTTFCRERWVNGKLLESWSIDLICTDEFKERFPYEYKLCGEWVPGRVIGARRALDELRRRP